MSTPEYREVTAALSPCDTCHEPLTIIDGKWTGNGVLSFSWRGRAYVTPHAVGCTEVSA